MTLKSISFPTKLFLVSVLFFWVFSRPADAQTPVSDDFNGSSLNTTLWTTTTPAGGNVTVSSGDAMLVVPGGVNHDAFLGGNNSVRILQTVSNADFDVAAKFDSPVQQQYEGEGILVVQNSSTYLRFELVFSGGRTLLSAALVSGGNQTQLALANAPASTGSIWLQVQRSGNTWTFSSSTNGTSYSTVGSFTQSFTITQIGLYAWNWNSPASAAPALTASVDYFHNLSTGTTAAPTFSPPSGTTFASSLSISILDSTAGETIYYTLDGSTPTISSLVYTSPISITASTTLKAFAAATGLQPSSVVSSSYIHQTSAGAPVSDDFSGSSLNAALWTASAPAGGSVTVSSGDAMLAVPGGSNHDAFLGGNNSVRILQTVSNADFDVAAKFDSPVRQQYEGEGILVVQSISTYLRFELVFSGSQASLSAALVSSGNQTQLALTNAPSFTGSIWLQVQRSGSTWTFSSSTNGISYSTIGSFTQSFTIAQIGLYAWNWDSPASAAPALTAAIDYFHNLGGSTGPNPPVITNVAASPGNTGAVISWTTDIPATSVVNYGTTTAYGGAASNATLLTSHSITLTGLTCGVTYDYDVSSISSSNLSSTSSNLTFTTSPCAGSGGPSSDNFDEPTLNTTLWTFVNPLGDGTVTMNGSAAVLNIPQGTQHAPWVTGNDALRLLQTVANTDFTVEVRFQSDVEIGNQEEGIMVQQDATHFVRYDVIFDGKNVILFAGFVQGTVGTAFAYNTIPVSAAPIWLRLQRTGNQWAGTWSTDGVTFNTGVTFTAALTVTAVGPFAGTSPLNGESPAFTAICDYFFNTASPIANQDGPPPFAVVTVDPTPGAALVEKALADIEGTGKLNPVVGISSPNQGLFWYGYPASGAVGGSWQKHTISATGYFYEDMLAYDVNGDGAVDLIASYSGNGSNFFVVWFENPRGKGVDPATVSQWAMHTIGNGMGEDTMALGDFDGDGKMDVATSQYVFFQNSLTSWTQVQYGNSFRGAALLDIGSGKGNINLVTTDSNSPYDVVWYENPRESGGNARTGTWVAHTIGAGYPCTPTTCGSGPDVATYAAGDLNGDGRADVVAGQSEGGTAGAPPGGLIWFEAPVDRRNGTWVRHIIDASYVFTHAIRLADMDKNGAIDLVTSEQDQSPLRRVSIFFNDGFGNFTQQVLSNAEGHNTVVGDIRKTGFLDVLNSGHGFFGDPNPLQIFVNPR